MGPNTLWSSSSDHEKISLEPPLIALLIKFIKTIKIVKEFQKYSIQSKAKQLSNCPPKTVSTNVSAFYRIKFPQNVGDHKKSWEKTRFTK